MKETKEAGMDSTFSSPEKDLKTSILYTEWMERDKLFEKVSYSLFH